VSEDRATRKDRAAAAISAASDELLALSHHLHADPETSFEEHRSAAAVAPVLEGQGFDVERGVYGLPTALAARRGSGDLVLALCAEYDALPGVGHACGHNVIAASSVGAAIGLAAVADEVDATVLVLGTPAEEGGGGKILMAERGAFDGVHAAMMVHPWPVERLEATCLAVDHVDVTFTGHEAHASAAPWEGRNAADAMVVAQVAIGLLRQQLRNGDQVHGIVTNGGVAANVIPASVTGRFMVRSLSLDSLAVVRAQVRACFEAGALATGCTFEVTELSPTYSHMVSNLPLLDAYRSNAEELGRRFALDDAHAARPTISTDMANVSLLVPSIHPLTAACITESADRAVLDGSTALAWTGIDAACDPATRSALLAQR
jgi:amidohydrolase